MTIEGDKTEGSLPERSDAEVFLALKANQPQALAILYDRHAALVYGIAYKMLGNTAEAEDLTQDIFLSLAHSSFDPRRGSLRTYLSIVVRSRCLDRLRAWRNQQRSLERGSIELQGSPGDPALEELSRAEEAVEVRTALAELSEIDILPGVNARGFLTTPTFAGWSLNGVDASPSTACKAGLTRSPRPF